MPGLKLFLRNETELEIYFQPGQNCTLSISNGQKFEFTEESGSFSVKWTIDTLKSPLEGVVKPEITGFQQIEFQDFESQKSFTEEPCCHMGEIEYCVTDGCMNAPCGRICG